MKVCGCTLIRKAACTGEAKRLENEQIANFKSLQSAAARPKVRPQLASQNLRSADRTLIVQS